jgi:hypothetical protein
MNVSNATIKSFSNGFEMTNAVIDTTGGTVAAVSAGATEVATIATSFFAGIRFAINERRGVKHTPTPTADAAAKQAAKVEELRKAIELFNRAHEAPTPAPTTKARKATRGAA